MIDIEFIKNNLNKMMIKDIAHELGCSSSTISRLVKKNGFLVDKKFIKMNRGITFSENSTLKRREYAKRNGFNEGM